MDYFNFSSEIATAIAAAADVTMKPWKHSVVHDDSHIDNQQTGNDQFELIMRIECRDIEGRRYEAEDLELEIFSSGKDINLTLSSCGSLDGPMLWQGQHSVWMDSKTGSRCCSPINGNDLEYLARRLRSLFILSDTE